MQTLHPAGAALPAVLLAVMLPAVLLGACTTIPVDEADVFQAKATVTPETFGVPGMTLTPVFFPAAGDSLQLNGWWLRQPDAEGTVLFFGGNGFFLVQSQGYLDAFAELPVDVFLFDYRGYGRSEGSPSVAALKADALAAYAFVTDSLGAAPERLVLHGHSIGTFLATDVGAARAVAGVVLENPITTPERWADHLVPWFLDPFISLDLPETLTGESNLAALRRTASPVLVLAGGADVITDPAMARELAGVRPEATRLVVVEEGGHNRLFDDAAWTEAYRAFLDAALEP